MTLESSRSLTVTSHMIDLPNVRNLNTTPVRNVKTLPRHSRAGVMMARLRNTFTAPVDAVKEAIVFGRLCPTFGMVSAVIKDISTV